MQYPRTHRSPRVLYFIIGFVAAIVVFFACGSTLYRQQFNDFLRGFEPSCTIGILDATVTVQGWSANDDCQQMLDGSNDNFTGVDWLKHGGAPASPTDGTVACEYDIASRHVTVRYGITTDGGNFACDLLNPIMPLPSP
jgi:hypothetical protein